MMSAHPIRQVVEEMANLEAVVLRVFSLAVGKNSFA